MLIFLFVCCIFSYLVKVLYSQSRFFCFKRTSVYKLNKLLSVCGSLLSCSVILLLTNCTSCTMFSVPNKWWWWWWWWKSFLAVAPFRTTLEQLTKLPQIASDCLDCLSRQGRLFPFPTPLGAVNKNNVRNVAINDRFLCFISTLKQWSPLPPVLKAMSNKYRQLCLRKNGSGERA